MMRATLIALLTLPALAAPAAAQSIDYVGSVTTKLNAGLPKRPIGDPRHVALSPLYYDGPDGVRADVLDLVSLTVSTVTTTRAELVGHFGHRDPSLGYAIPPSGHLVSYDPASSGFHLEQFVSAQVPRRHWYAEIDGRTGAVGRSTSLGALAPGEYLEFAGTDAAAGRAWWVLLRKDAAVLRRLDLRTLAVDDVMTVPLTVRTTSTGYENHRFIHAAADFSRFAVVEYYEDGLKMQPGHVFVLDPVRRSSFAVVAPSTAYGLVFSPDGKHMYLGSCQHGTITRIDMATRKVDRRMAGPRFLHHLALSPDGKALFALASSKSYAVYDPGLTRRSDRKHDADVAAAAEQLFGGGVFSRDGFFVLQQASPSPVHEYVITRLGS